MPQPYSQNASGAVFVPGYGWMSQQDYIGLGIDPASLGSPAPAASPSFTGSSSGAGLAPGMMFPGYTPPINVPLVPPGPFNFDVPSTVAGGGDSGPSYDYPGYVDPGLGLPPDEVQPPAVAQGPPPSPDVPFAPPPEPSGGGVAPPSDWGRPTDWQNVGNVLGNVAGGIGNFFRGGLGGLPPGFVEGNRFGGGAPTFTGPGFTGPQWTPGGSIFGQLPGVRGGPLTGSFAGLGAGSAGTLTQPWQNFIGTRSPAYLKWMAMRGINRHEATRLFEGSGGPASVSGATQGAQHAGQHISPT